MARTHGVPDTRNLEKIQGLTKREAATLLADAGFVVAPLPPLRKEPPPTGWRSLEYRPASEVKLLWTGPSGGSTESNIAVPTGRGFFVLDFDKKKGGLESYKKMIALSDLPDTFTVSTRDHGYHVYLSHAEPLSGGANVLDHVNLPGVDLRADGNYVVGPGSEAPDDAGNPSGYSAANSHPIAQAPAWLIDAFGSRKRRDKSERHDTPATELDTEANIEAAINYLLDDAQEAIEQAGGDDSTFKVACFVRDFGVSEQTAFDLMAEHWNPVKAVPPWDYDDLATKVRNAFSFSQNQHGSKAAALAVNEFPPLPQSIIDAISAQTPPTLPNSHGGQKPSAPTTDSRANTRITIEPWQSVTEPNVEWLVDGILPQGAFATLYGQPGSYKSFVALYVAAMVASKQPVLGRRTSAPTDHVLYIAAEGGSGLRKRLDAIEHVHNLNPNSVGFIRHPLDLRGSLAHCDELLKAIKDGNWRPSLIVIDTLARSFGGGNENSSEDMGAFINVVDFIRATTKSAILVVHHSGKDTAKGMRGHSALFGAVDSELEVEKIRNAPEEGAGTGGGRLRVTKQKDGPDGYAIEYAVEKVVFGDAGSAEAEFGGEGHDETTPAQGKRSSLAVREWQDGEARAVELTEVKLSTAAHGVLSVLRELCARGEGEARVDAWKRSVLRREICTAETWAGVRKELKTAGAFTSDGNRIVMLSEIFKNAVETEATSTEPPPGEAT